MVFSKVVKAGRMRLLNMRGCQMWYGQCPTTTINVIAAAKRPYVSSGVGGR